LFAWENPRLLRHFVPRNDEMGVPRDDVKGEHSNDASNDERGYLGMRRKRLPPKDEKGGLAMTLAKTKGGRLGMRRRGVSK